MKSLMIYTLHNKMTKWAEQITWLGELKF